MEQWVLPAPLLEPSASRVAIVSGSYGAGHNAAAAEIARELTAAGAEVTTYDVVELLPLGLGSLLRWAYYTQLRRAPSTWGITLGQLETGRPMHRLLVSAFGSGAARASRVVAGCDLVIATHPFAAQMLGAARDTGLVRVPVVTYLTDASVHSLWVHPAVDVHLAIHEEPAQQARARGARCVAVEPVVRVANPAVADPLAAFGVCGARALVTGGSLGIGELEQTAHDVLRTGVMVPVVACGSNQALAHRLSSVPGVVALGWRDDLPDVIAASDCVVQNAGGFTCLEALAAGTPVVTYRPIPGHGVTNAESLERAGLASWPRSPAALRAALVDVLAAGREDRIPHDAPTLLEALTGRRLRSAPERPTRDVVVA